MLLYCMNPKKFQACQFLIKFHEARGDKVIVFSDNVFALEVSLTSLRVRVLKYPRRTPRNSGSLISTVARGRLSGCGCCNGSSTILMSTPSSCLRYILRHRVERDSSLTSAAQVGDTSIDLPEATCLIQISSHFGSRRQEAQRLGMLIWQYFILQFY